jgi:hypothetical protein
VRIERKEGGNLDHGDGRNGGVIVGGESTRDLEGMKRLGAGVERDK